MVRRLGMFAGAMIGPVVFFWMTYYDNQREIFRPEYQQTVQQKLAAADAEEAAGRMEMIPKPSLGGPFTMIDARTGKEVNEKDVLLGKWTLLYFGFTKCAEICPNTVKFITGVMDKVEKTHGSKEEHADKAEELQLVFVTIDTVRDGPKELLQFLARFRKDRRNLVGLYGDDDQTRDLAQLWRVYFSSLAETDAEAEQRKKQGYESLKDAIAADDSYQFDHSAATYFIGPDGKLRDFFFREMGAQHAVDKIGLHWDDAYGIGAGGTGQKHRRDSDALPTPKVGA